MYNGQVEKYVAAIFAFGAPSTINAGLTRYLAALGAAVTTTEQAVVIPHDGWLKNLYWSCESSGLNGSPNKITVMVNGAATTLETTWNGNLTSGNNLTGSIAVTKGQRLAVRVQLASGGTGANITRLRVSLELEVDSQYPNPWDFDGVNIISSQANSKIGIGTGTPNESLTLGPNTNLAVEMPSPINIIVQPLSLSSYPYFSPGDYTFWITASDGMGWTTASSSLNVSLSSPNNNFFLKWDHIPTAVKYGIYCIRASDPTNINYYETIGNGGFLADAGNVIPCPPPLAAPPVQTTSYTKKISASGDTWFLDNVGIGVSVPQTKMHVSGIPVPFQGTTPGTLRIDSPMNAGSNFQAIDFGYKVGSNPTARIAANHHPDGSRLCFGTSGLYADGITNTAMTIDPAGHVIVDTLIQKSSRVLKTNIQPIEHALNEVMKLCGVTFDWKKNGKRDVGLIAEDVEQVIPEVVLHEEGNENAQGINYSRLVAVLIEAVKEQQDQIEELKAKVNSLLASTANAMSST